MTSDYAEFIKKDLIFTSSIKRGEIEVSVLGEDSPFNISHITLGSEHETYQVDYKTDSGKISRTVNVDWIGKTSTNITDVTIEFDSDFIEEKYEFVGLEGKGASGTWEEILNSKNFCAMDNASNSGVCPTFVGYIQYRAVYEYKETLEDGTTKLQFYTKPSEEIIDSGYTITLYANTGIFDSSISPEWTLSDDNTKAEKYFDSSVNKVTMPDTPTKEGYVFNGWGKDSTCTIEIDNFDSINVDTTLYACWTINSYVLTVNPNGGSWGGSSSNQTFTQNYGTTKSIATPTRTGYTFAGWTLTGGGTISGTTYTYGTSAGTLTASWTVNTYTISFDKKSGSGGTNQIYQKYGVGLYSNSSATTSITSITIPKRTGYKFSGYHYDISGISYRYISPTGTFDANITNGGAYKAFSQDVTLYASWAEYDAPTVTLHKIDPVDSWSYGTYDNKWTNMNVQVTLSSSGATGYEYGKTTGTTCPSTNLSTINSSGVLLLDKSFEGAYNYCFRAVDSNGNKSQWAMVVVKIDQTAPLTPMVAGNTDAYTCNDSIHIFSPYNTTSFSKVSQYSTGYSSGWLSAHGYSSFGNNTNPTANYETINLHQPASANQTFGTGRSRYCTVLGIHDEYSGINGIRYKLCNVNNMSGCGDDDWDIEEQGDDSKILEIVTGDLKNEAGDDISVAFCFVVKDVAGNVSKKLIFRRVI